MAVHPLGQRQGRYVADGLEVVGQRSASAREPTDLFINQQKDGCRIAPACLECPREKCIYDGQPERRCEGCGVIYQPVNANQRWCRPACRPGASQVAGGKPREQRASTGRARGPSP